MDPIIIDSGLKAPIQRKGIARRTHFLVYFLDIGAFILISLLVYVSRGLPMTFRSVAEYGLIVLIAAVSYSVFAFYTGQYDWRRFRHHIMRPVTTFAAIVFAFGVLLIIGFSFKLTDNYSRIWLGFWFSGFTFYILISRLIFVLHLSAHRHSRILMRPAVILGAGENGQDVLEHLLLYDDLGIEVAAFLDDRADRVPESIRGVPVLSPVDKIEQLIRSHGVDLVIFALPWHARQRIRQIVKRMSTWAVDIYIAPDKLGLEYADRPIHRLGGMYMLSLKERPISDWDAVVKRIEDLCIAIPAVILLSPLLILVALAIKLESKGNVLFVQERYGFNNNLIRVYKFRSMYTDMEDRSCERQTVKDDPRITQVGRLIRKTSIDELPQLFNVIKGCMSIVGPRPHAVGTKSEGRLFEEVVDEYASRHRVKPGITGWAQCNGWRGETDTREKIEKRVEHDLYYIENWSIFLDLMIIVKTALVMLGKDENAY